MIVMVVYVLLHCILCHPCPPAYYWFLGFLVRLPVSYEFQSGPLLALLLLDKYSGYAIFTVARISHFIAEARAADWIGSALSTCDHFS